MVSSYEIKRRITALENSVHDHQSSFSGAVKARPCGLLRLLLVMAYDAVILVGLLLAGAALASPFDSGNQRALQDPVFSLYLLAIWFAYLAACWRRGGMTVGMRAWRVRIETEGGRPAWSQCLVRFGVSLGSAACAGIGFAWLLVDQRERTWHDIASKTRLVRWSGSG